MGVSAAILLASVAFATGLGCGFYLCCLVLRWSITEGRFDRRTMERMFREWEAAAARRLQP